MRDYGLEPEIWGGDKNCKHQWGCEYKAIQSKGGYASCWETGGVKELQPGERSQGNFCQLCGAWRGCLGLEPTPELYVQHLVEVFRKIKRVLAPWGIIWVNIGDTYSAQRWTGNEQGQPMNKYRDGHRDINPTKITNLPPKNLVGIPWLVAFALRADGWYLRRDIIWHKPNPMPESCTDRPTTAHEYLFLLSQKPRYFYDADAIREPHKDISLARIERPWNGNRDVGDINSSYSNMDISKMCHSGGRNRRSVWTIATKSYPEAHFATFPPDLVIPCIKAGAPIKVCTECGAPWERSVEKGERIETGGKRKKQTPNIGNPDINTGYRLTETLGFQPTCECSGETKKATVFDPFGGSGTVAEVAYKLGCDAVILDVSEKYCELAVKRLKPVVQQERLF